MYIVYYRLDLYSLLVVLFFKTKGILLSSLPSPPLPSPIHVLILYTVTKKTILL